MCILVQGWVSVGLGKNLLKGKGEVTLIHIQHTNTHRHIQHKHKMSIPK